MNLNNYSKESVTLSFYIVYLSLVYVLYTLFPGNETDPNLGVAFLFLLIPISLIYAIFQAYKHFNSDKNYLKCLLIHAAAWFSIIAFLTGLAK
jgi:hypothetical protein